MIRRRGILASGGMDSFLVWALYGRDAVNYFVDIGHKYARKEWMALRKLEAAVDGFEIHHIKGPYMGEFETPSGIIPMRNAELIIAASHFADEIMLGILKDEINSDKSETFLHLIECTLNESWRGQYWNDGVGRSFNVHSPIRDKTKGQLVRDYMQAGLPLHWLASTISCYDGDGGHCGECASCAKRWMALKVNDLADINEWRRDPRDYIHRSGIAVKALNGTYAQDRAAEVIEAMRDDERFAGMMRSAGILTP